MLHGENLIFSPLRIIAPLHRKALNKPLAHRFDYFLKQFVNYTQPLLFNCIISDPIV